MKIATYNANSIRRRMPIVLNWLAANSPDILCLQETKVQDVDFPLAEIESSGYSCVFKGQKSYNGVAILSKIPLSDVSFGLDDSGPPDEPRLIRATSHGIAIVNTYIPQGYLPDSDKFQYKLDWFKRLGAYFQRHFSPSDPVLWCGDLNIAPQPIDVHDPVRLAEHVCFRPQARRAFEDTMSFGFVDCFRIHHPDEPNCYTFWDYRFPRSIDKNTGWRLDHIMTTKPLATNCTNCWIDKSPRLEPNPSDHTVLVAEFDVR